MLKTTKNKRVGKQDSYPDAQGDDNVGKYLKGWIAKFSTALCSIHCDSNNGIGIACLGYIIV
jgi:hypothetical protein